MMEKYFDFLDDLRDSGETNMFGAAPYLQAEFPELRGDRKKPTKSSWLGYTTLTRTVRRFENEQTCVSNHR